MKNGLEIDHWSNKRWYKEGRFHREDGPAIEYANGDKSWHKNGELHREDGPAVITKDGDRLFYLKGKKTHRT
jgi:hypothetical protein